jgi:hypothetical protein
MKRFVLAALLTLAPLSAFAADAPKPAPPAAPTSVPVQMTSVDLQVALIAIRNAGAACDLGATQFCQLLSVRDATATKLQTALTTLTTPPQPTEKK